MTTLTNTPYVKPVAMPQATCSFCGVTRSSTPVYTVPGCVVTCLDCLQRERRKDTPGLPWVLPELLSLTDNLDHNCDAWLAKVGLAPAEIRCRVGLVPRKILTALPQDLRDRLSAGCRIKQGAGLIGAPKWGKTACWASLLRLALINNLCTKLPDCEFAWYAFTSFAWVDWPAWATRIQMDPFNEARAQELKTYSKIPILILDDVGREQRADRTTNILAALIDERDRFERPTLWTSNYGEAELEEMYLPHLMRRLTRLNPAIQLPKMATWSA